MGILDGQAVNASITNPAFINKNNDDVMPNVLGLSRTLSGASIADIQVTLNKLYTATGASETQTGTNYNATANTISNGDSYQMALGELADKFDAATGHFHTGSAGDGPLLHVVRTLAASGYSGAYGNLILDAGSGIAISQSSTNITVASTITTTGIAASGSPYITGNVNLAVTGSGLSIFESGQTIYFAVTGNTGGGGGGSLQWVESVDSATPLFENNIQVYGFQSGLSQSLYSTIKVPHTYTGGTQIAMRTEFYSPDSSGTVLLQSIVTLIRTGTDNISSTINQRTSTNSAVTLSSGTVNVPQEVILDLSDATGKINGVSVSANDTIIVQLIRGTDTGVSVVRNMSFATEVSFT